MAQEQNPNREVTGKLKGCFPGFLAIAPLFYPCYVSNSTPDSPLLIPYFTPIPPLLEPRARPYKASRRVIRLRTIEYT